MLIAPAPLLVSLEFCPMWIDPWAVIRELFTGILALPLYVCIAFVVGFFTGRWMASWG